MKKLTLILMVIIFSAAYAWAQPPGPTPHHGPPPGPPDMEDFDGPPPGPPPMDQRREAMRRLMKKDPKKAKQLMRICKEYPELQCGMNQTQGGRPGPGMRPGHGPGMMGPDGKRGRFDPEMMERKQKLMQMRMEARELGKRYQETQSAAEKKKIDKELRKRLAEIYKLKLEIQRARVKQVEEKLKRVKQELAAYEKDQKGVISSWFDQLTGKTRYKKF